MPTEKSKAQHLLLSLVLISIVKTVLSALQGRGGEGRGGEREKDSFYHSHLEISIESTTATKHVSLFSEPFVGN
jgi:hypothetical protein